MPHRYSEDGIHPHGSGAVKIKRRDEKDDGLVVARRDESHSVEEGK